MPHDHTHRSCASGDREFTDRESRYIQELTLASSTVPQAKSLPMVRCSNRREVPAPIDDPYNAIVRWTDVTDNVEGGTLAGIGVSLKDSIAIANIPLTCGSAALQGFVPSGDSTVTRRLLQAGAEIRAVTNMDDLAFSGAGETSYYGPVRNPRHPDFLAGGSSGGAAASLFLEGIDVAVGTDQGGSVRVPAAWCGVYGLKPTFGRVPYTGVVGMEANLDHIGILARTPELIRRTLLALEGPDGRDPRTTHWGAPDCEVNQPKVRILRELTQRSSHTTQHRLSTETVRWNELGVQTEYTDTTFDEFAAVTTSLFIEGAWATLHGLSAPWGTTGHYWEELQQALARGVQSHYSRLSAPLRYSLEAARQLQQVSPGLAYGRGVEARQQVYDRVEEAFGDSDFLLLPTTPSEALPIRTEIDEIEQAQRGWHCLANTGIFNISGHPAISIPLSPQATSKQALPVGAMLIGRHGADESLLAFADRVAELK